MKINKFYLDDYQMDSIVCLENVLLIAGAGSGKTSTILGKVKYLIENKISNEDEILCLSLTNETTVHLKNMIINLGYTVDVKTFHKLGLDIIKDYKDVNILSNNILKYIIQEYFLSVVKFSYRKYLLYLLFLDYRYDYILKSKKFFKLINTIENIINICKCNNYNIEYIYNLYKKSLISRIVYLFVMEIFLIYERELDSSNTVDFNDMINDAINIIINNKIMLKYKYIIIDEFQDTNLVRLNLIKAIINNNNAKIFCVGDDYQSIYRFNGCNLNIFLNINDYIECKIMFLKNTYRNCRELLYISNDFICKNRYQINKELISFKSINKPIKIINYHNRFVVLKNLFEILGNNVMVLGRFNDDIRYFVDKSEDIKNINYYTIHKSKGLESDNVILINLYNGYYGFPSSRINDKYISNFINKDCYKYDEERRLFYVALTRTRNCIYLLVDKNNSSYFVTEIIKDYSKYIEIIKVE